MPNMSASDLVGRRVRQARQRRGWTVKELAARCEKIGAPHLSHAVITNLETQRRGGREVTVDELLALARVLDTSPLALLTPTACKNCADEPPAGFTCNECGRSGS